MHYKIFTSKITSVVYYKKLFTILLGVVFLFTLINYKALYAKSYNDLSVFYRLSRPSENRVTAEERRRLSDVKMEMYHGFGASYNNFRADYSTFFKGSRITINYDIWYNRVASPYVGLAYIFGSKVSARDFNKQKLDGYDALLGLQVNIYNILKPYVEYQVAKSLFIIGVRVHIPLKIKVKPAL
ncbi:hypothetical protein ABSA28_00294 [Candidatus Hepatincolaceae symbiont of Richtersius coronifer]